MLANSTFFPSKYEWRLRYFRDIRCDTKAHLPSITTRVRLETPWRLPLRTLYLIGPVFGPIILLYPFYRLHKLVDSNKEAGRWYIRLLVNQLQMAGPLFIKVPSN